MVSYMHPRSRSTSSLFITTLLTCFVVVGLPHIIPCPSQRRDFADAPPGTEIGNGVVGQVQPRKRRRRSEAGETNAHRAEKAECPMPKPRGLISQILGFKKEELKPRPVVEIEPRGTKKE
ncbi:MAG: hypothetical protein M1834_005688 [Cirrosporium novae-zelandiae]|nr:MAG: hypothetical protein M1834_005688 [Cirrosporium novae-zelandiae]